ncbi:hypothetical protein J3E68DRAFT_390019 [Trichoderma sp. SZMC 28012]
MQLQATGDFNKRKAQVAKAIKGIKWALYKKDRYTKFITDISALIQCLERKVDRGTLTLSDSRIIHIARACSSLIYEAEHDGIKDQLASIGILYSGAV